MFVACGIWCLADVSSVSPSSLVLAHAEKQFFSKLVFVVVFASPFCLSISIVLLVRIPFSSLTFDSFCIWLHSGLGYQTELNEYQYYLRYRVNLDGNKAR